MIPWSLVFQALSPSGHSGRLSVLIFHRVLPAPDPIFPEDVWAAQFDAMLGWLKRHFNVLALDQAVSLLKEGRLPARALAITFDDGYQDNRIIALPLLQKHGLSATFFVATGYLDGGRMWNDEVIEAVRACRLQTLDLQDLDLGLHELPDVAQRRRVIEHIIGRVKYQPVVQRGALTRAIAERAEVRLPDDLMMTSAQVVEMHRAGMQIGAHTVSHPILAVLPPEQVRTEIADGRRTLENLLGERVGLFAYPNGKPGADYREEDVRIVEQLGFDAAFSTVWGAGNNRCDSLQIPRFTPWDRTEGKFMARMAQNLLKARMGR